MRLVYERTFATAGFIGHRIVSYRVPALSSLRDIDVIFAASTLGGNWCELSAALGSGNVSRRSSFGFDLALDSGAYCNCGKASC